LQQAAQAEASQQWQVISHLLVCSSESYHRIMMYHSTDYQVQKAELWNNTKLMKLWIFMSSE
jgi:hypothetical protein